MKKLHGSTLLFFHFFTWPLTAGLPLLHICDLNDTPVLGQDIRKLFDAE